MEKKDNYEDYSSGRVLYGAPGATNFPARLAQKIFQRCTEYLSEKGNSNKYVIYDPFCGAGYSLTVLGLLHGKDVKTVYASDADKVILEFAGKNLSLLSIEGIERRKQELEGFINQYSKTSHKEALESANRLENLVRPLHVTTDIFQFDMLSDLELPERIKNIDIVLTDLPYGKLTEWSGQGTNTNPAQVFLDKIKSRLSAASIIAIVSDKKQKIEYKGYERIEATTFGKRKVLFLMQK